MDYPRVYMIRIDGNKIVAVLAYDEEMAKEICRENWNATFNGDVGVIMPNARVKDSFSICKVGNYGISWVYHTEPL